MPKLICLLHPLLYLLLAGQAWAHPVPSITVEAVFQPTGTYTLSVNLDPRTFLAAEPRSLPPVPAPWYREQSAEQIAATHARCEAFLTQHLRLRWGGREVAWPPISFQAIDGADNAPLRPETLEVHLLATASGDAPSRSEPFEIEYAKSAPIELILLSSMKGEAEARPQVLFPGETSRRFQIIYAAPTTQPSLRPTSAKQSGSIFTLILAALAAIAVFIGWLLLSKYRHYHRAHRKPQQP
jgi:hypothetical protein